MPITVKYGNGTYARTHGLKDYFTEYNVKFYASGHGSGHQGFSTVNSSHVNYDGYTYGASSADLQYASRSDDVTNYKKAWAFIAEAKTVANGGQFGQLVYSSLVHPTHTLFGDLDTIKMGTKINVDPVIFQVPGVKYSLGKTEVTFSKLTSVLNEGVQDGHVIYWDDPILTNDVHEIIHPLIGGDGTTDYTSGLEAYLNSKGIRYDGSSANEWFDGFNGKDVFELGGGTDKIHLFNVNKDKIELSSSAGFSTPGEAANEVVYGGGNATLDYSGGSVTIFGVASGSLDATNFIIN